MNPVENLVIRFQELVAQVPELLQPFVVALAGAVPFIEWGAAPIGVVGGMNPVVAVVAAAMGNVLCLLVVVLLGARVRAAAVRGRASRATAMAGAVPAAAAVPEVPAVPAAPGSRRRRRVLGWLDRFGVPGASILGALAVPTQLTSAVLVAAGIRPGRVLLWQGVAIALWATAATTLMWLGLSALLPA